MTDKKYIHIDRKTGNEVKRVITAAVPEVKDKNGNIVREARAEVFVMDPVLVTQEQAFKNAEDNAKKEGFQNFTMVEEDDKHFAFRLFNPVQVEEKPIKKKK